MRVLERSVDVAAVQVFLREASDDGEPPAILYVHGVPTGSWDWLPFLERTGGLAPDLPGFGGSAKPGHFEYSIAGYDRFLEAFAAAVGLDRFSLVLHDWGAVALAFAERFPERIERLVLLGCLPLLPGFRWHRMARTWRRPLLGELLMGFSTKAGFRRLSRDLTATPGPLPEEFIDAVWRHFDHGTQRAVLKLHRSAPEWLLARAGERLGELRCPALILWPAEDPCVDARFGRAYADALGGQVRLELVEKAGHWPWLDRPDLVDRTAEFLRSATVG